MQGESMRDINTLISCLQIILIETNTGFREKPSYHPGEWRFHNIIPTAPIFTAEAWVPNWQPPDIIAEEERLNITGYAFILYADRCIVISPPLPCKTSAPDDGTPQAPCRTVAEGSIGIWRKCNGPHARRLVGTLPEPVWFSAVPDR